jgi:hypothetical protein
VRVAQAGADDDLPDHLEQLLAAERQLQPERLRRAREARQVVARTEERPVEEADPFEDTVAVEQPVIPDRDPRLAAVQVVAVEVDDQA